MSWFNPRPVDASLVIPRQIPRTVVPSRIRENGQIMNLLMHHGGRNDIRDYSPIGQLGTMIGGCNWHDGSYGLALEFDGSTGYVSLTPVLTTDFTILTWIKHPDVVGASRTIYGEGRSTSDNPVKWLYLGGTGLLVYFERSDANVVLVTVSSSFAVDDDDWHLVGVACNGGQSELYIDGSPDLSAARAAGAVTVDQATLGVLHRLAFGYWNNGLIGIHRIYNSVLAPAVIAEHWESTRSIFGV